MKKYTSTPTKVSVLFLLISVLFSCTKDSDLFADVLINEDISSIENAPGNNNPAEETDVTVDLVNGSIETNEDVIAVFGISDLSSNSSGKSMILTNIEQPVNGEVEIEKDSIIRYIPNSDFNGTDTFSYTLELTNEDNSVSQEDTSIEITVNPVSDVVNDEVTVTGSNEVVIPVLNNDTFTDKNKVVISGTSEPAKGTVIVRADKSISYTPYANTSGADSFNYNIEIINDDGSTSTEAGTVSVTLVSTANPGDTNMGELKAFPGAEGFGKNATGGRGGDVYFVTNLNGSGAGSLQYGLDTAPAVGRTIIFRVAGWINHGGSEYLVLKEPNITIAGQTAPGGGIGIRGELRIQDNNVIVRHISVRNDDDWAGSSQAAVRIGAYGSSTEDIILDHVSLGWAHDENLTLTSTNNSYYVNNVTIQNCIIDNNLDSGYNAINYWNVTNSSYYQNLLAYSNERNIGSTTCEGSFEYINNMCYSYSGSAMEISSGVDFDVIGNHWDTGGNTLPWGDQVLKMNFDGPYNIQNCEGLGKVNPGITATGLYYYDNLFNGSAGSYDSFSQSRLQPGPQVSSGIAAYPAYEVKTNVLANAGAYNGLSQGMNSHDADLLNKVQNDLGGSRLTSRKFPADFPSLANGSPYTDSDFDGMADSWEVQNFGDLSQDNNGDYNSNGYTNLEEFLHFLTQ